MVVFRDCSNAGLQNSCSETKKFSGNLYLSWFLLPYYNQFEIFKAEMSLQITKIKQSMQECHEDPVQNPKEEGKQRKVAPSWTKEQNKKYANFIKKNQEMFKCERRRRVFKVFKLLSQEILSKTMKQCKSHHQKMLKRYGCNNRIMAQFLGVNPIKEEDKITQECKIFSVEMPQQKIESNLSILQLSQQQTKQGSSMTDQDDLFQVLTLDPVPWLISYSVCDFI